MRITAVRLPIEHWSAERCASKVLTVDEVDHGRAVSGTFLNDAEVVVLRRHRLQVAQLAADSYQPTQTPASENCSQ